MDNSHNNKMTNPSPVSLTPFMHNTPLGSQTNMADFFNQNLDFDTAYLLMTGNGNSSTTNLNSNINSHVNNPDHLLNGNDFNHFQSYQSPNYASISPSLNNNLTMSSNTASYDTVATPENTQFIAGSADIQSMNAINPNTHNNNNGFSNQRLLEQHRNKILTSTTNLLYSPKTPDSGNFNSDFVSPNTRNLLHSFNSLNSQLNYSQLINNNNNNELLSLSETSVLENFLDSIANDKNLTNLSKHWSSIDPLANPNASRANEIGTNYTNNNHNNNNNNNNSNNNINTNNGNGSVYNDSTGFANNQTHGVSSTTKLEQGSKTMNGFKRKLEDNPKDSKFIVATESKKVLAKKSSGDGDKSRGKNGENGDFVISGTSGDNNNAKRPKKGKLSGFSAIEKRIHHTSTEQRRRAQIKDAFDILSDLIKDRESANNSKKVTTTATNSKRKNVSKYTVLSSAVDELKRLVEINQNLKKLIDSKQS